MWKFFKLAKITILQEKKSQIPVQKLWNDNYSIIKKMSNTWEKSCSLIKNEDENIMIEGK